MPSFNTERTAWVIITILGVLAFTLGYIGWQHEPDGPTTTLDVIYRTLWLFKMDAEELRHDRVLQIAQFLAPLVTLSAIVQLGLHLFASQISLLIARNRRGHTVICGLGNRGTAFADSLIRLGEKHINIIDANPTEAHLAFCRQRRIRLIKGDCRDPKMLQAAGAARAERIIITTPNDNFNLETAAAARKLADEVTHKTIVQIHTAISDRALWSHLVDSDAVKRLVGRSELRPFSLPVIAARKLFWDQSVYSYADMRGQSCVHAVFVGFDDYAVSALVQMMRACLYKDFRAPLATVLVKDAADAERSFFREFPAIRELRQVRFKEFDPLIDELSAPFMADVEAEASAGVSLVVVCIDPTEDSLSAAIYVHAAVRRLVQWNAPIFVRMDTTDGGIGLLTPAQQARRFDEMIVPFGTTYELSDVALLEGLLERSAQRIHDGYQGSRKHGRGASGKQEWRDSDIAWAQLPETYRQANRRAADHIKAKLASAGFYVPPGLSLDVAPGIDIGTHREIAERLAGLEHDSWRADRHIDGWVQGRTRDNRRKIHTNLVSYEELDEPTKDYDRDQIKLLDGPLLSEKPLSDNAELIRVDHWLGLIGTNALTDDEKRELRRRLNDEILPDLLEHNAAHCFTLATSLTPGADLVLTKTMLDFLESHHIVHRLIVPEGVPEALMIKDFMPHFLAGRNADGAPRALDESWEAFCDRILKLRHEMTDATGSAYRRTGWVIDLCDQRGNFDLADVRRAGYVRQGTYVVRRSHTLIAALGSADSEGDPSGLVETLKLRATLEGAPPPDEWPMLLPRRTIKIDLAAHAARARTVSA